MSNLLSHMSPELKQYLVKEEDFEEECLIGHGTYGDVNKRIHKPTGKVCAVKTIHFDDESDIDQKKLIDFCREVDVLQKCSNHMFVVPFYGWTSEVPLLIVTEYINNGSLYDALRKNRSKKADSSIKSLTGTQKSIIALGIAHGMKYLHGMGVIHRDLKSENILLDDQMLPRISDFGVSRFIEETLGDGANSNLVMTKSVGTPHWMAPELILSDNYTNKVDIYAYGMLLWEMLSEKQPFHNLNGAQITLAVCQKGERPSFPHHTPKRLKNLIIKCWAQDPNDRPTFDEIYNEWKEGKIHFEGTETTAINYIHQAIADDEVIRKEKLNDQNPPLKYNKYNVRAQKAICADTKNQRSNSITNDTPQFIGLEPPQLSDERSKRSRRSGTVSQKRGFNANLVPPNLPSIPQRESHQNYDFNKLKHIKNPNYLQNFDECVKHLDNNNSPDFFKNTLYVLSPETPINILEHAYMTVYQLVKNNQKYYDDFIAGNWLNTRLPIKSETCIQIDFDVLKLACLKTPRLITNGHLEFFSGFINKSRNYGIKTLVILQPILTHFDKMSNGWVACDHILKHSSKFLDSCPLEYLDTLNYLLVNFPQFKQARLPHVIPILLDAVKRTDYSKHNMEYIDDPINNIMNNSFNIGKSQHQIRNDAESSMIRSYESLVFNNIYTILLNNYQTTCTVPVDILNKHLNNPETVKACMAFVTKQKTEHLTQQTMQTFLNMLPQKKEAYYAILCNCDRTQSGDSLLQCGTSWMVNKKMDREMVGNLLLVLYGFANLRHTIANSSDFYTALVRLVQTQEPLQVTTASTLILKSLAIPNVVDHLKTIKFFNYYIREVRPFTDERSIKSCATFIDSISRITCINEFEYLIDYLTRFIKMMSGYTILAVSAFASMCQHPTLAAKVKAANLQPDFESLASHQQIAPYANAVLVKIK